MENFAEKNVSSLNAKATHIFSAKILYVIFNDQSFNNTLANVIVSFEQMCPAFSI